MTIPIRELSRAERPALHEHFIALDRHDRRLLHGPSSVYLHFFVALYPIA